MDSSCVELYDLPPSPAHTNDQGITLILSYWLLQHSIPTYSTFTSLTAKGTSGKQKHVNVEDESKSKDTLLLLLRPNLSQLSGITHVITWP